MRNVCAVTAALTVVVLVAATIVENLLGTPFVTRHIYGSLLFVALWAALAITSVIYLAMRHIARRPITLLLHLSFVVILAGALVTHLWGTQGTLHLRVGDAPAYTYNTRDGGVATLPFGVELNDFGLDYYKGTTAPMDFVSNLTIHDGMEQLTARVSMNNIYSHRHYRFYQSTYDSDSRGSTLSVYHDPYGIAVTYTGYCLLILSMLLFFAEPGSHFRALLRHPALRRTAVCLALAMGAATAQAAPAMPKTVPDTVAARFGELYVYYNDRICPMQTLARDFTTKLYGKPSYRGLSAEQVMLGWFFYYDDWKEQPMIRIKSGEVRRMLGVEGNYARLTDFYDAGQYKLAQAMQAGSNIADLRGVREAEEKFNLLSLVGTGNAFKIFPYREEGDSLLTWYSVADRLPASMPQDKWMFVRYCMNLVAEQVALRNYDEVSMLLTKTRKYQQNEAGELLPSAARIGAERVYNAAHHTRPTAMLCLTIGILSFLFYCYRMVRQGGRKHTRVTTLPVSLMSLLLLYMATMLSLRGFIAGHFPASNGFETMQLMAVCIMAIALALHRRYEMIIAFGYLLSGLALLVAMMGEANPPITQLMPVLSSPLLSIHVVTIMIAYSLFGFAMLNGIVALVVHHTGGSTQQLERLQVLSHIMLYPATFLLAAGIFIGAVWANVSWGRYWGWDPKEVWALITLLIYAAALHTGSLPALRRPVAFHRFAILAFMSVLITYFGVNFILGGLHGYA